MKKIRIYALLIVLVAAFLGYFNYASEFNAVNDSPLAKAFPQFAVVQSAATITAASFVEGYPLTFGLDLRGGARMVYRADTSKIAPGDVPSLMAGLREVIERRLNPTGVSEIIVQTEEVGGEHRLVIEIPGVYDLADAEKKIGETPILEFKVERPNGETQKIIEAIVAAANAGEEYAGEDPYIATELTGQYLERAFIEFNPGSLRPSVGLQFNAEGAKLFSDITRDNLSKVVAIYLDGGLISDPVVQQQIRDGKASISGASFTQDTVKELVSRLNSGALPVSIEKLSAQTIGASLGEDAVKNDSLAALYGFLAICLFLVLWYRVPGLVAAVSLLVYVLISIALFKLIPVVLTSAGIAGFILSIGMAVDANVLIFERTKEELKKGLGIDAALREGFHRAWPSIRDSNVSSLITAFVLFWLGTSLVKGFALAFGLGVVVSMFTAITVTRTFLFSLGVKDSKAAKLLFSNGLHF